VSREKNKNRDQPNQKDLANYRLLRMGYAHRNTPGGLGVGCLHLQLAKRLRSARRSKKLPAQTNSVKSG
ncbi:MAG TPA: hypothetical protein VJT50_02440, partial [Pyrinomonadaceae bacterium]|nr:hypothetical protein [Pyrinomonadaceae bacterium]